MARPCQQPRFDPYEILFALERQRTTYIIVGALARVLEGAEEITRGIDITPSTEPENLRRLDLALAEISAHRADWRELSLQTIDFAAEQASAPRSPHPPTSHACSPHSTANKTFRTCSRCAG